VTCWPQVQCCNHCPAVTVEKHADYKQAEHVRIYACVIDAEPESGWAAVSNDSLVGNRSDTVQLLRSGTCWRCLLLSAVGSVSSLVTISHHQFSFHLGVLASEGWWEAWQPSPSAVSVVSSPWSVIFSIQCFDTVGSVTGRASGL